MKATMSWRSGFLTISASMLLLSSLVLLLPAIARSQGQPADVASAPRLHRLDPKTPRGLRDLLRHGGEPLPLVSGHRGGAAPGFPENCIVTFEHTLQSTYALLEIDPRYTKDGQMVIHHDATLERTTTGRGKVADFTLAELKQLRLKDRDGNVTDFQIPTLDEVLQWARGRAVLVLDQKDVPIAARAAKIRQHQAAGYAMLIAYSYKDAQACHALDPDIVMEVMVPTTAKVAEFDKLNVPWHNVVAFVGHNPPQDAKLYEMIHARGACCMIGTSRNLDRKLLEKQVADIRELEPEYRAFLGRGADLIETDIPSQLGAMLYGSTPAPAAKRQFFSH